jgi:hypothetical protein
MSEATVVDGTAAPRAQSPLGRMLGLSEDEVTALGTVFVQATRVMGIEGGAIFERLRKGDSLGRALKLPRGTTDLLYARAHRWFSIGRYDRAEPLFRALCVLGERVADHWVGFGVCLRLRDNLPEAGVAFQTAAGLRPDWAVPHFHALELAMRRGDWAAATQCLSAYDQRASDALPEPIRREAERLRAVLAHRQDGSPS